MGLSHNATTPRPRSGNTDIPVRMRKLASIVLSLFTSLLPTTVEAVAYDILSNPDWDVSNTTGNLGKARNVCLNTATPPGPLNCPAGAPLPNTPTVYGYSPNLWTATLSSPLARWIWSPLSLSTSTSPITGATSPAGNQEFTFRKEFYVCAPPDTTKPQTLWLAADDSAEVRLNGALLTSVTGFAAVATASVPPGLINVAPTLNTIEIKARNGSDPANCTSYQCNPAGMVFGASLSDTLPQLPKCPGAVAPNHPTGQYDPGEFEEQSCPQGQVGRIFRGCGCAHVGGTSIGFWGQWNNTCSAPVPRQACVGFDSPAFAVNTQYGATVGQTPGHVALLSNGITGSLEIFLTSASANFNKASIESMLVPSGVGQSMRLNNISVNFDFSALNFIPSRVTFGFLDFGGEINMGINGNPSHVGYMASFPPTIGTASVAIGSTPVPPSASSGKITLNGAIKTLLIGGQELLIDEVCAVE